MAEHIDKEFVIDTIEELKSKALPKALLFDHLKKVIEIFPTEDFAPVKLCPTCGAKMDGGEGE